MPGMPDEYDIFSAVRHGDFERVQYLVRSLSHRVLSNHELFAADLICQSWSRSRYRGASFSSMTTGVPHHYTMHLSQATRSLSSIC